MPCWSIHQPMSATEDHRAITGRPGMVDFWRRSGMPWCLGVRFGLGAWVVDGRFLPSDSFPHSRSRHRTRGPVARPVSEDEDLDGSGTCRKSVLEPSGAEGQFVDSDFWSFGGPGFAMNLLIDVSAYMFLKCWSFFEISFFWLPARFIR